eukprot:COSAG01_NODE_12037_length_1810_cov_1.983635_1_plen_183_part_00
MREMSIREWILDVRGSSSSTTVRSTIALTVNCPRPVPERAGGRGGRRRRHLLRGRKAQLLLPLRTGKEFCSGCRRPVRNAPPGAGKRRHYFPELERHHHTATTCLPTIPASSPLGDKATSPPSSCSHTHRKLGHVGSRCRVGSLRGVVLCDIYTTSNTPPSKKKKKTGTGQPPRSQLRSQTR